MQLFPASASSFTCCTHLDDDISKPTFSENFTFVVSPRKLASKTLQVNVWAVDTTDSLDEECVVSILFSIKYIVLGLQA